MKGMAILLFTKSLINKVSARGIIFPYQAENKRNLYRGTQNLPLAIFFSRNYDILLLEEYTKNLRKTFTFLMEIRISPIPLHSESAQKQIQKF